MVHQNSISLMFCLSRNSATSNLLMFTGFCLHCIANFDNISNLFSCYSGSVGSAAAVSVSSDIKRVYTSHPPAATPLATPITPGTQIILSEGVANGAPPPLPRVSINPIVSLPLHPVPQSQTETMSITR